MISGRYLAGLVSSCSKKTPSLVIFPLIWRSAEHETPIPTGQDAPWRGRRMTRTYIIEKTDVKGLLELKLPEAKGLLKELSKEKDKLVKDLKKDSDSKLLDNILNFSLNIKNNYSLKIIDYLDNNENDLFALNLDKKIFCINIFTSIEKK